MTNYEKISLIINVIIGAGAVVFACLQYSINKRLKKLQDYVSILATANEKNSAIALINTGKIDMRLWGFEYDGVVKENYSEPRLIACGPQGGTCFYISPPSGLKDKQEFRLKLYLEDAFGKKWISEHGGRADAVNNKLLGIQVWTYKIYKKKWSILSS